MPKQNGLLAFINSVAPASSMMFLGGIFTFLGIMWSQGESIRSDNQEIKTAAQILTGQLNVQKERSSSLEDRIRALEEEIKLRR